MREHVDIFAADIPKDVVGTLKRHLSSAALEPTNNSKVARISSQLSVSELVTLELCAGSANLSSELRALGFQVLPIDHASNSHTQKVRTVLIDLSRRGSFELVAQIIQSGKVFYVHMSPPCGTCSAARDKIVPISLQSRGAPNPPPLRDATHPEGFPWLSGKNAERVKSANSIYLLCSKIALLCISMNIILSIENPYNSWFWQLPCILSLFNEVELEWVYFQACMHGSSRNKWTGWLCTKSIFTSMILVCDNKHTHAGWNLVKTAGSWQFDTSKEAEYPRQLCVTAAHCVLAAALRAGYSALPVDVQGCLSESQRRLWKRATTGKLPRGRTLPQLVSEFETVVEKVDFSGHVPKNSRLLRQFWRKGDDPVSPQVFVSMFGVWRTPEKFISAAVSVNHPYDSQVLVPDCMKRALFNILTLGPVGITKKRCAAIIRINKMAKDLAAEEKALHATMDTHNQRILRTKRFLLFGKLLQEGGFDDKELVSDLVSGFDVVGKCPPSTVLQPKLVPATITVKELLSRSQVISSATIAQCKPSGDAALDEEVFKQTMEERDNGWMRGPFSPETLSEMFPNGWVASNRFGLRQATKVRNIDNLKTTSINYALSTTEKLALMDTDDFAAITRMIMDSYNPHDKAINITLDNGEKLTGVVHQAWIVDNRLSWKIRTLDLEAAYKQLCNSPSTKWACVIAVYNPSTKSVDLMVSDVLAFGATSSVYSFNRFARGLWTIAVVILDLLCTQFYDDYPSLEPGPSARGAKLAFESLLKILGWTWAKGKKDLNFEHASDLLGVNFDVTDLDLGTVTVSNKPSRISSVCETIKSILVDRALSSHLAAELAGKIQYADSQIAGRAAIPATKIIRERANDRSSALRLTPMLIVALEFLLEYLNNSLPRQIVACCKERPIVIFTDGSSEGISHLWGAVVYMPGVRPLIAAGVVPKVLTDAWKKVNQQIITQVELFPTLLLKHHFGQRFSNRRVLWFIDNDGSRDSLISGASDSVVSMKLVCTFCRHQRVYPSYNWFARVASYSNPADLPSRSKIKEAAKLYGADIFEALPLPDSDLLFMKE